MDLRPWSMQSLLAPRMAYPQPLLGSTCPTTAQWRALGLPTLPPTWPTQGGMDTCGSRAIGADLVDLVGLRRHVPRPVIDEAEVTALVKGTAQVGLPLGRIGLIHPLSVLPRLLGPGLGQGKKTGNHREPRPSPKPSPSWLMGVAAVRGDQGHSE